MLTVARTARCIQTALQIYCRNYKQADVGQTHGLLRKARRLDQILEAFGDDDAAG